MGKFSALIDATVSEKCADCKQALLPKSVSLYCAECLGYRSACHLIFAERLDVSDEAEFDAWRASVWKELGIFHELPEERKLWCACYLCTLGDNPQSPGRRQTWWRKLLTGDMPAIARAVGLKNLPQVEVPDWW